MHHIALCSYKTHLFARPRVCGAGLEVQVERAQVEASTNLVWMKVSPSAFNPCSLPFILNLALCYSWLCIRLIGVV
jgi:hypothetical protein